MRGGVILRCELLRASKDDWFGACGRSFETPRKRAAPQDDGDGCGATVLDV
jgi:hypothetical protein